MKCLIVTKIVKEIKFEGVWGELESKKCLQRQTFIELSYEFKLIGRILLSEKFQVDILNN